MIIRTIYKKGRIVIPKVIRDVLGLKEGTPMVIDLKGEKTQNSLIK